MAGDKELPGTYELGTLVEDVEPGQPPSSLPINGRASGLSKKKRLSMWHLGLVSLVNAGQGFVWALQLSLLTPYIQTLGVEHEFSSIVWLCGPVAGLVVQPIVGMWSDNSTSKWGKRRPFILKGVLSTILAVIVIGFGSDIGSFLGDTRESCQTFKGKRPRAAVVVIIGFWVLDFASNAVNPPLLGMIADLSEPDQRVGAQAINCFWGSSGSVIGYAAGSYGKWHNLFPALVTNACCAPCANLKAAFLLATIALALCVTVTLILGQEAPAAKQNPSPPEIDTLSDDDDDDDDEHDHEPLLMENTSTGHVANMSNVDVANTSNGPSGGVCGLFVDLIRGVQKLPKTMNYVLVVMSLSWFSWFPFILFDTDWMGREVYGGNPSGNATEVALYQRGVEEGSFGLLLNSVVSGASALVINTMSQFLGSKNVWALANFLLFLAMVCMGVIASKVGRKVAAVTLFAVLGFPYAITLTVPYSMTAELTAETGGGQGLAIGILNIAIVVPQTIVTLGAGPLDGLFGGGNEPAFAVAAVFGLVAAVVAVWKLPTSPTPRVPVQHLP